jgi:DNA recombination protein RmuC
MVIVAVLAGVVASLVVGALIAACLLRYLRVTALAERQRTVGAATDAALERAMAVAADRVGQQATASSHELDLRSQAIGRQLGDMNAQLQRVGDLVTSLQRERAEQHGQLVQGLTEASRSTAALAETTQTLRQALASPKARGQWGERMAEDVLRLAGFVEGVNYRTQTALPNGTIPDITFLLPQGLLLHMDVKFPVDNYLRYLEGSAPKERDAFCTAFVRDVRTRVKDLAGRGYAEPDTTVGYVLLFIPNESVYGFVHEHDPRLVDAALEQKVVLCSPCTLFAVLAVVRQAVDSFLLERASDEILDALGAFRGQWQKFSESVDTLGGRIASTQKAFDEMAGPRRRQLERRLDAIDAIRERHGLEPVSPASGGDIHRLREVPAG